MKVAGTEGRRAVEHADIVEAEKAALKDVLAFDVLPVHPPREIDQQLVKHAHQKFAVRLALNARRNFVNAPRRPGVHGRIHIRKIPLVGGQFAVRVHVPFAQKKNQLVFRVVGIDQRHGHAVEAEIPRGVPGILPLVRHGDHVRVVQVRPVVISPKAPARIGLRLRRIAVEPALHVVVVALLAPEQARQRPAVAPGAHLRSVADARALRIEFIGLLQALREDVFEFRAEECFRRWPAEFPPGLRSSQPAAQRPTLPGSHLRDVMRRGLRSFLVPGSRRRVRRSPRTR